MLKRYGVGKREIWISIIYGGAVGLMGVIAFVFFLKVDWGHSGQKAMEVTAPVDKQAVMTDAVTFYALQHGAFSTDAQAQSFIARDPALMKALSIPIDGRYYVWSRVATVKDKKMVQQENSFIKTFSLSGASCSEESLRALPKWLASENSLKFNFGQQVANGGLPKDWVSVQATAVSISDDMDVVRLHLIFHYVSSAKCLSLQFDK